VREAAQQDGRPAAVANPRILNMMRGGILYVKISKALDDLEEGDEGVPSRARQVSRIRGKSSRR